MVQTAPDGTRTYGLPKFLSLEVARTQPRLKEYIADQYGSGMLLPATEEVELLQAK